MGLSGPEGMEVVAGDDEVSVQANLADPILGMGYEGTERNAEVVVVDERFPLKFSCGIGNLNSWKELRRNVGVSDSTSP